MNQFCLEFFFKNVKGGTPLQTPRTMTSKIDLVYTIYIRLEFNWESVKISWPH